MQRLGAMIRLVLFVALTGCLGLGWGSSAQARQPVHHDAIGVVRQADLPEEARHTLLLIQRGGPFPFPHKDGSVFGNFENRLPPQPRGYYREYTVPTPGRHDRGARRVVAGIGQYGDITRSGEYYYTGDHYRRFRRIVAP